jgi:hypothetical protein
MVIQPSGFLSARAAIVYLTLVLHYSGTNSNVLFVKNGRKFLRFQIGILKKVPKMYDLRSDDELNTLPAGRVVYPF